MAEVKEIVDKVLEAIEVAKATGKIKKGTNEVTKALERGTAKLVAVAGDASPAEIVMHIPVLAEEKGVACVTIPTKEELGASAGIAVPTASVAIVQEGESKALIAEVNSKLVKPVEETKEVPKEGTTKEEAKPAEKPKESAKKEVPAKKPKKEEKPEEKKEVSKKE